MAVQYALTVLQATHHALRTSLYRMQWALPATSCTTSVCPGVESWSSPSWPSSTMKCTSATRTVCLPWTKVSHGGGGCESFGGSSRPVLEVAAYPGQQAVEEGCECEPPSPPLPPQHTQPRSPPPPPTHPTHTAGSFFGFIVYAIPPSPSPGPPPSPCRQLLWQLRDPQYLRPVHRCGEHVHGQHPVCQLYSVPPTAVQAQQSLRQVRRCSWPHATHPQHLPSPATCSRCCEFGLLHS